MEERKFKEGQKVILKGTKEGLIGSDWTTYFGQYDIKKGDTGIVKEVFTSENKAFITTDKPRPNDSGFLTLADIEWTVTNWRQRLEQ